jgi:hypothetical protein
VLEARQELGRDVLGVGRAAADAGKHELVAVAHRPLDDAGNGADAGAQNAVREGALEHLDRAPQVVLDRVNGAVTHGAACPASLPRARPLWRRAGGKAKPDCARSVRTDRT